MSSINTSQVHIGEKGLSALILFFFEPQASEEISIP